MKAPLLTVLSLLTACLQAAGAQEFRPELSLNGAWQAARTESPAHEPPASGWRQFDVPGVLYGTAEGGSRYVWLRREVAVPAEWRGRRVLLTLMGAKYYPHLYVDGRPIGSQADGYVPFEVEVTDAVEPGSTHRIELRCQDWGATFVEGYTLPEGGWDSDASRGKVLLPIGGHVGFYGPWDDVLLVARPDLYLTDEVIVPSVREGTLTVSGGLSGQAEGALVEGQVLEDGRPVLGLPGAAVSADGRWEISAPFPDAHYWSPEDPHLYGLRLTLRRVEGGPALDVVERRFGFKEFWADGPDFYLNGVKRHLLATSCWPPSRPQSADYARNAILFWKDAHCVAFRQHTQPWRKHWTELADELGMMMIVEAAMWTDSGHHAYEDERFWQSYREHLAGMVRRDRNNASVIMWSLENEFLSVGNDRYFPPLEEKLAELGPFVKALDPHHLITYESDLDPGGVADVIGLHYPHELPNHHDYPNTCDWLAERTVTEAGGGLLGTQERDFFWDRAKPLYIGEYLWVPARDHSPGTVFFGDRAYENQREYHRRAQARAWFDQTVAYRRAGVSGLCPWAIGLPRGEEPEQDVLYQAQKRAYEPVAAFLRDRDTRFFGGRTIERTFDVFNDSPTGQDLELRWQLGEGLSGGSEALTLPPAGYREFTVQVPLPEPDGPAGYAFRAGLFAGGERVHEQAATLRVEPLRPVEGPAGVRVVVYDPERTWQAKLEEAGLRAVYATDFSEAAPLDAAGDLLIVAPGAASPPKVEADVPTIGRERMGGGALSGFLNDGGRALVLEQTSLEGLPVPAALVEHASTMTFPLGPPHPVLEGLGAEDLKFWRGDNYVTRFEVRRPTTNGARALTVSGGRHELDQAPIVEMQAGAGRLLLVQALVSEKLGTEPAARRLLQNALDYLASDLPQPGPTALVAGEEAFAERLRELGVQFSREADDGRGLLILHGGGPIVRAAAPRARGHLEAGGTVYWHAPDAPTFARLAPQTGAQGLRIGPAQGPVRVTRGDHPLLAGVSREDLHFTGPPKSWMREADLDPTVVDRAVQPDVPAGGMRAIELGELELEGVYVSLTDGGISFATVGTATGEVEVPQAGFYVLVLRLSGTPAEGLLPIAAVRVNGEEVASTSLTQQEPRDYAVLLDLPRGRSRLAVAFVNDRFVAGEDRNMMLHALRLSAEPWEAEGLQVLTQPPALTVLHVGGGRLVLDGVRWDTNAANATKGLRYASGLLANLGATFIPVAPAPAWVPGGLFEPVGEITYFQREEDRFGMYSAGTVAASFESLTAGTYEVLVHGHSTPAAGVYGRVAVDVDGARVGEVGLDSGQDRAYSVGTVRLATGRHTVAVEFVNDQMIGNEDRNIYIRAVGFRRQR
jgi:hypothetical protein